MKQILTLFLLCLGLTACRPMPDPGDRSKKAVSVDLDHMAVFTVPSGTGLVDITDVTWTETRESATYRWRFFPTNGVPDSGTGEVYAHLISLGPAGKLVNNSKYQPWMKLNDHMWAEWSYQGPTSVWLYYHPDRTTIQLLPDDQFDTYPKGVSNQKVDHISKGSNTSL